GPPPSPWSGVTVFVLVDMNVLLLRRRAGHEQAAWAAPRAARERSAATQQLQQQQQEPATRHRSTARRFVSIGSRRVDTPDSLPNDIVIKPTAVPEPTAGQRPWEHLRCGIAAARRRRKSTSSAATAPKAVGPLRDWHPYQSRGARRQACPRRPDRRPGALRRRAHTTPRKSARASDRSA